MASQKDLCSGSPRVDSVTLLYSLQVQNLLPMQLSVEDMKFKVSKVISPGATVNYTCVSLNTPTTFKMTVRQCVVLLSEALLSLNLPLLHICVLFVPYTLHLLPTNLSQPSTLPSYAILQLIYAGNEWEGILITDSNVSKLVTFKLRPLQMTSVDDDISCHLLASLDITLSVMSEMAVTWELSIFCPYWIVNKTGLTLQYSVTK